MARAARSISGELRGKVDDAAEGRGWSLVIVAMLAVGREGLETALFLWAATRVATRDAVGSGHVDLGAAARRRARHRSPPSSSATCSTAARSRINLSTFFTWTGALPDPGRRRRPVVRRPRPPGGRRPARPEQPGLRRLRHDRARHLVRHPAQGDLQLLPGHHLARGSPPGCSTSSRSCSCSCGRSAAAPARLTTRGPADRRPPDPSPPARSRIHEPAPSQPPRRPAARRARARGLHRERRRRRRATRAPSRSPPPTTRATSPRRRRRPARSRFDVTNSGSDVTEFYLLGEDGLRIVGEVENIGPSLDRQLVVDRARGQLRHRLQARHEGRRASATTSRSPPPTRRSRSRPTTRS